MLKNGVQCTEYIYTSEKGRGHTTTDREKLLGVTARYALHVRVSDQEEIIDTAVLYHHVNASTIHMPGRQGHE